MAKPKLSSKTPDTDDTNALIPAHDMLVEHFNSREHSNRHIAIVEYGVADVKLFEGGGQQATVVTRHIELVTSDHAEAAEKLFTKLYQERTNNKTRPAPETPDTPLEDLELDDSVE